MEIMINGCYGGFGFSLEALEEYYKKPISKYVRSDKDINLYLKSPNGHVFAASDKETLTYEELFSSNGLRIREDIDRTDERMIEIVRSMGDRANGMCADIRIIEIPDDIDWVIEDYDGKEHVAEKHSTWY